MLCVVAHSPQPFQLAINYANKLYFGHFDRLLRRSAWVTMPPARNLILRFVPVKLVNDDEKRKNRMDKNQQLRFLWCSLCLVVVWITKKVDNNTKLTLYLFGILRRLFWLPATRHHHSVTNCNPQVVTSRSLCSTRRSKDHIFVFTSTMNSISYIIDFLPLKRTI